MGSDLAVPRLWSRRAAGMAGFGALAAGAVSASAAADPLAGAALYAEVRTYAGFGDHRTGSAGDQAAADWLARQLQAAGYAVERPGFEIPVFDVRRAEVTLAGRPMEAFPIWTPGAGAAKGPLSMEARPGAVTVLSLPFGTGAALGVADAYRKPIQAAIDAGASGVVAVTENPLGELVAFNAPPEAPPWRVPVLAVAGHEGPALLAAARAGTTARLVLEGEARVRRVENLVASRERPGKALVISTPRSGWFTCAGERGSGIAIWLGLARALAAQTGHNLLLMAATAHEFDGFGGHQFVTRRAPPAAETKAWLHIGANVASYDFGLQDEHIVRLGQPQAGRRLACSEVLLPAARQAFAGQPGYAAPIDIDVQPAPGEVAEYQRLDYRPVIGVVGGHPLHHTRRDLPDATGPELLEPVGRGLAALLRSI